MEGQSRYLGKTVFNLSGNLLNPCALCSRLYELWAVFSILDKPLILARGLDSSAYATSFVYCFLSA